MSPENDKQPSTSVANRTFEETFELSQLFDTDLLLDQLERVETAIWIFDFDYKRVIYANRSARAVWSAGSLEELRARHMGADMSKTVLINTRETLKNEKSVFRTIGLSIHTANQG